MHTVLRLIKCQVSKRKVHCNNGHDIQTLLDVQIDEAIMTIDREIVDKQFANHSFLRIKHINHVVLAILSELDSVTNCEFGLGSESFTFYFQWVFLFWVCLNRLVVYFMNLNLKRLLKQWPAWRILHQRRQNRDCWKPMFVWWILPVREILYLYQGSVRVVFNERTFAFS